MEEDESFAPYQEATSARKQERFARPGTQPAERNSSPGLPGLQFFSLHNWATFEAVPQAKTSSLLVWGEAVFHADRIINICGKVRPISTYVHVHHDENHRLTHSTQRCVFLHEHISTTATRAVLFQCSDPWQSWNSYYLLVLVK